MRLAVFGICVLAFAQEQPAPTGPPVLEYSGKPLVLPLKCADEDIQLAGLTCSEDDPCQIYLELAAVASTGNRILAAGNLHSSSVTMFSTLLLSEDGGRTWTEPAERIRSAALDRVQILDENIAWAAGEILQPLPQDPFLLLTTDGGKSWRRRTIFSESAENRYGVIQQFHFTARDNGSLIVDRGTGSDGDRFELYESPNGGESWSFKQSSSKPLTLRRPAAVSTEWRLRVDSRTQSYRVERRSGERWSDVSAFTVKVGVCKP